MAQEILQSSNRMSVSDRTGQLIVQRFSWPVTVKTNADTVVVGYLPADHKLHIPACQVVVEAAVANSNYDLCLVSTSNVLLDNQAHTTATLTRAALTTYSLGETLGVSSDNRAVILLLNTAPAAAGGTVHVDLAYYAP
jgi:hypothetical protein